MTRRERLSQELHRLVRGCSAARMLDRLLEAGLIDLRRVEESAILHDVAQRTARGEAKCRAMARTADEFCCSYEKVRGIIYRNKD